MSIKKIREITKQIPTFIKAGHIVQAMQLEKVIACTFKLSKEAMEQVRGLPPSYIEKLQSLYSEVAYSTFQAGTFQADNNLPLGEFLEDMIEAISHEMGGMLGSIKRDLLLSTIKDDLKCVYNEGSYKKAEKELIPVTAESQQTLDKFEAYVQKLSNPMSQKVLRYYLGMPIKEVAVEEIKTEEVKTEEVQTVDTVETKPEEQAEVTSEINEICNYNPLALRQKILDLLKGFDLSIEDDQYVIVERLIRNVGGYDKKRLKEILEQKLGVYLTENFEEDLLSECAELTGAVGLNGDLVITEIDNNMCLVFVFKKDDYASIVKTENIATAAKKEKSNIDPLGDLISSVFVGNYEKSLREYQKGLRLAYHTCVAVDEKDEQIVKSLRRDIKTSEGLINDLITKMYLIHGNAQMLRGNK